MIVSLSRQVLVGILGCFLGGVSAGGVEQEVRPDPKSNQAEEELGGALGFDEFVPRYNGVIREWVQGKKVAAERELTEAKADLARAKEAAKKTALEVAVAEAQRTVERFAFREGRGDYFAYKSLDALPKGLEWETGMGHPEIGDPRAKKGGTFHSFMPSFPVTVRPFGARSNGSFRSRLYDSVELGLVDLHPSTGGVIPAVAKQWAVSEDGRTVYFKLDPEARYNDGAPVVARDFMVAVYLRVSDVVTSPYSKQYFREQLAQVAVYDEHTLAVTLSDAKPRELMPYYTSLTPSAPHFYDEYGPGYEERYNWRVPPTTGAYFVKTEDIVMGDSITMTRATDWWARDRKYYRHRFNADRISCRVERDRAKVWDLFRAGEIDSHVLTNPETWDRASKIPEVSKGYIERHMWFNQFPRPPYGLYLNTAQPILTDRNVRLGLSHAMDWDKVLKEVFGGEYSRLPGFVAGYGDLVNPEVKARSFSPEKARRYFALAGFSDDAPDGTLRMPGGRRLEVSVSHPDSSAIVGDMMAILKEEAKKAGVEFVLDPLSPMDVYRKQMRKEHEMVFAAWSFQPPFPRFHEYFHSSNAYDEKGILKQDTNNVFSFANNEMDLLTVACRNAGTWEEKRTLGYRIQKMVHEEAVFIPGYMREFERLGCWRWMRWPDAAETRFCPKRIADPLESYVYWIDEDRKRETLEAIKRGKTFPEVENVVGLTGPGGP